MKLVYILTIFVIAALTLGCIENKTAEPKSTGDNSQIRTSATTAPSAEDPFGTDADVAYLDSMLADSTMNISLSDSI